MGDRILVLIRNAGGKGKAHGGAWKVAFADFMTAMMAFFLVMWLLASVSPSKREAVANYLKNYKFSIFPSGKPVVPKAKVIKEDGGNVLVDAPHMLDTNAMNSLLMLMIDDQFSNLKNKNLTVATKDEVVRIELADSSNQAMFESGSSDLSETTKKILKEVAKLLQDFDNKIAIEGHTDASKSKTLDSDNWNLSLQRAFNAQKELTENGIPPARMLYIVGYADKRNLPDIEPESDKNRRVSVLVFCAERLKSLEKYIMPENK
jgi:chemotaxis protein MotB